MNSGSYDPMLSAMDGSTATLIPHCRHGSIKGSLFDGALSMPSSLSPGAEWFLSPQQSTANILSMALTTLSTSSTLLVLAPSQKHWLLHIALVLQTSEDHMEGETQG